MTRGTGAELPGLFARVDELVDLRAEMWLSPPRRALLGLAAASATLPMHGGEGIALAGQAAGMVTAGTASAAEPWAGALVAPRGSLRLLDSARIDADGVRRQLWPGGPAHAMYFTHFAVAGEAVHDRIAVTTAPLVDTGDDQPPADETGGSELERMARALGGVPAAVEVERPVMPELTDRTAENARRLFALTVAQLAELFGVTERQMHRYLRDGLPDNRQALADALVAVGLTVIGGLGAEGARRWLYSGEPTGAQLAAQGRIAELTARAQALRDSPVT